ncbi:hypothetical protein NKH73_09075 [Mesorhizobium sp. M0938]|uniref:hypothetical protein n=1 Tax=unclassified Mesorhizobium TaxID=325217 RepID=UPI003338B53B
MADLRFAKLNESWNADPNAPHPSVEQSGNDILLRFLLNSFQFKRFVEGDVGILRFRNCSRYRIDPTNDHAWFGGSCRYSALAPGWGEFYELVGDDPTLATVSDWNMIGDKLPVARHFLFYFRDEMFECFAEDWSFEHVEASPPPRLNTRPRFGQRWRNLLGLHR